MGGGGGKESEEGEEGMCAHDDGCIYVKDAVPGRRVVGDRDNPSQWIANKAAPNDMYVMIY